MLGNVMDSLHALSHLNLKIRHGTRWYNSHFTDGGTEAQRGYETPKVIQLMNGS